MPYLKTKVGQNKKEQLKRIQDINRDWETDPDFWRNYGIINILGQGAFGTVYLVKDIITNEKYALKFLKNVDKETINEVNVLKDLTGFGQQFIPCPGIVRYLDAFIIQDPTDENQWGYGILMEYIEGPELFEYINDYWKNNKQAPSPEEVITILEPILQQLACIHENGIVHRDIKPENIIVITNRKGQPVSAKLIDFGLSCTVNLKKENINKCFQLSPAGTMDYLGPEVWKMNVSQKSPSDIWSLGITMYEFLTGRQVNAKNWVAAVALGEKINSENFYPKNKEIQRLVKSMINIDSKKRPTSTELLQKLQNIKNTPQN